MVTQTDIDNLNAAIAQGERSVTIDGESVTYRSVSELIAARNDLVQQLANQSGATSAARPLKRYQAIYGGRGYNRKGC